MCRVFHFYTEFRRSGKSCRKTAHPRDIYQIKTYWNLTMIEIKPQAYRSVSIGSGDLIASEL